MNNKLIKTGSFKSIKGKILILGSRATTNSLNRGMYYTSNKKGNIIWDVLDAAFSDKHTNFKELQLKIIELYDLGEDTSNIKKQMIDLLSSCNVGLSDVFFECESADSLDTSIKNGVVNPDLEKLCIEADVVLLNGSMAGKVFKQEMKKWKNNINYIVMPSTSETPGRFVKPKKERIKEWSVTIKKYRK